MTGLVHRLPAWSANLTTRESRRPKILICDTGLAAHLTRKDPEALAVVTDPTRGPLVEMLAVNELHKQSLLSDRQPELFHYRDHRGALEADLVTEAGGQVVAWEVKASLSVSPADARGLRRMPDGSTRPDRQRSATGSSSTPDLSRSPSATASPRFPSQRCGQPQPDRMSAPALSTGAVASLRNDMTSMDSGVREVKPDIRGQEASAEPGQVSRPRTPRPGRNRCAFRRSGHRHPRSRAHPAKERSLSARQQQRLPLR